MDFDEYEYLEKMVENPEAQNSKEVSVNGGDELVKSGDKDSRRSSRRRGEDDDDDDRKSKRSKDDVRDRDRDREKSSSRHRSRSRDRERSEKDVERRKSSREHRDKDKEREERNGRDRDRGREREREKEKEREKEREKGKEKEKEKEKEMEKEKEKERERDREAARKERDNGKESERDRGERDRRSRSHSSRHREDGEKTRDREFREKSREREHREKSRDREFREKSRDRDYGDKIHERDVRDKESRRHKEKKDETTEPEADPERDQRTVFAYQLPLRADERDIFEFFSRVGKVRDVRLIMDRNSRRSKGVGYIEFYDVMSVPMAIALSGQLIRGQPVMVKPSEAEKNLVQSTSTTAAGLTVSGAARRLYVGNLVPNITEEQLRVVFEAFGTIELVQLPRDEAGLCKGFAFVQFARLEDAKSAQVLNGQLDIGGRFMKVSAVTDQPGMQDAGATTGDLDDDEGGGLSLNASSRALLMQKLDRSSSGTSVTASAVNSTGLSVASAPMPGAPGASSMVAPTTQPSVFPYGGLPNAGISAPMGIGALPMADTMGVPSECLLLKNMFDPNVETEPDFDLDIKEDVQDECAKFGALKHIFVDKHTEGFVYLKFGDTQAAMNAQRALHGRWFAGKMISATYMLPQDYEAKFPESR